MITAKQHKRITKIKRWIIFPVIICCIIIVSVTCYYALTKKQEIPVHRGPYLMEFKVYYHNDSANVIVWRIKDVGAFGRSNWSNFKAWLFDTAGKAVYNCSIVLPEGYVSVDDLIIVFAPYDGHFFLRICHVATGGIVGEIGWDY